jgi:dinuclear metal center YbgI/SA1388 family protein
VTPLETVITALDELLQPERFADYCPNGLQVSGGAGGIRTVVTGVSAHLELFERAVETGADLVLVHHGLFWDGDRRGIDELLKRRLKLLFDNDIALAAYHLPLDAHPELGNNALIANGLGCDELRPFADHIGRPLGVAGHFGPKPISAAELLERVQLVTGREPLYFDSGPAQVASIGIVSGAGARHLEDAIAAGLDAFLTGEPSERVMAQAAEAQVHFIAAGHYATETFGVRALGELLERRFGIAHIFIDVPNPI